VRFSSWRRRVQSSAAGTSVNRIGADDGAGDNVSVASTDRRIGTTRVVPCAVTHSRQQAFNADPRRALGAGEMMETLSTVVDERRLQYGFPLGWFYCSQSQDDDGGWCVAHRCRAQQSWSLRTTQWAQSVPWLFESIDAPSASCSLLRTSWLYRQHESPRARH
jgi:hypothetical protein